MATPPSVEIRMECVEEATNSQGPGEGLAVNGVREARGHEGGLESSATRVCSAAQVRPREDESL